MGVDQALAPQSTELFAAVQAGLPSSIETTQCVAPLAIPTKVAWAGS